MSIAPFPYHCLLLPIYFSVAVLENTAGHAIWDSVNVHNAEVSSGITKTRK